jgi:peroxiredoxin
MSGRAAIWLLSVAVAFSAVFALLSGSRAPTPVRRGVPAPAFELPQVGSSSSLNLEQLRGKVVLINFWATWCKPCEDEMPAMERLYQALRGSAFELVAISVDDDEALVDVFARRLGLTFPVLMDQSQRVAAAYQTDRFPESLLVGRDGVVVERYIGPKDWDAEPYLARIRRLLANETAG